MTAEQPAPFDHEKAAALVGKRVLVGITEADAAGVVVARRQFWGVVRSATPKGVAIELGCAYLDKAPGDVLWMPPAPETFKPAEPGVYTLRSNGESIEDPDFTTTWRMTAKRKQRE